MPSFRSFTRIAIALTALALALPAAAGSLSPRLQALQASWQKAPEATLTRAVQGAQSPAQRLFSPRVNHSGKVQVYMHYRAGHQPGAQALARLGASDVLVSPRLGVVQAWVPIAKLNAAAALAGVSAVGLPTYAYVKGARGEQPAADSCDPVQSGLDIDNEGVAAQRVGPVQAQDIKGAGVKVGIISDGADCRASSQQAGYLPSSIHIVSHGDGNTSSGDEGTAMLEEVHAIAPDATLGFCGPNTSADFLHCLDALGAWGADVISDDLGFFPFGYNFSVFDDDNGNNGITKFADDNPDIVLTTAGGNSAKSYLEADYKASTNPSSAGFSISLSPDYTVGDAYLGQYMASDRSYDSAMNIGKALGHASDAAVTVTIYPGATIYGDLTWNDPASGPYDDLDLFLFKYDKDKDKLLLACQPNDDNWCSSTLDQMTYGPQEGLPPFELLVYTNNTNSAQTLYLVAYCYDCNAHGTNPLHVKLYGNGNGGAAFNYNTQGGIAGHTSLDAEITVAAAQWGKSGVRSTIEPFSDRGPFTYGDWTGSPKHRDKPDITGIDAVTISGAGGFGSPLLNGGAIFSGTSAASPNIGAVVALLKGYNSSAAPDAAGWKDILADNANSSALTNYSKNAGGAGLVDAKATVAAITPGAIDAEITTPAESPFKVDPDTDVPFVATCDYNGDTTPTYDWIFGKEGSGAPPAETGLEPQPVQYANGGLYTATFTCSAGEDSGSDNVTIAVQAAAHAEDQSLETGHNQKLTGQLTGSDIGGEAINYKRVKDAAHGSVSIAADGSFTYTPKTGFSGTDTFEFQIDNGVKESNAATVTVDVAKGSPPKASDGSLSVKKNKTGSGTLNATDPDGDALIFSIVSQPSHGTVTITDKASGAYTYKPESGYVGSDSFTFKANDGSADSNTATVSVTVTKASSGGGGGGAFGGLGLGLLGLLLLALRRKR
jgi:hypothetical protein